MTAVLYHYWRSSSSWRVRWALLLKGVAYEAVAVDLLAGAQRDEAHVRRNPQGLVPVLRLGDTYLAESVAIIEYLDETIPQPPLLPGDALGRARVRQLVQIINADTQPVQNLSVLRQHSSDADSQKAWARHFITRGLQAYEALLGDGSWPQGRYSYGAELTMADLFLVPQCYNARRFGIDVGEFPRVAAVEAACLGLPEAKASSPDQQRQ